MYIVKAEYDKDIYFIFREDNTEIRIDLSKGYIKSDKIILSEERDYINKFLLKKSETSENEEQEFITNLAEQGYTEYYIANKIGRSVSFVSKISSKFWRDRMKK